MPAHHCLDVASEQPAGWTNQGAWGWLWGGSDGPSAYQRPSSSDARLPCPRGHSRDIALATRGLRTRAFVAPLAGCLLLGVAATGRLSSLHQSEARWPWRWESAKCGARVGRFSVLDCFANRAVALNRATVAARSVENRKSPEPRSPLLPLKMTIC